ncbi:hypothetical protein ABZ567_09935 [Streptomyces sp. NPDC016459]|uniref:hypothetical protein n=1 Tax=Streptomyces sp. NPDC016459 TaxID=3157190 RepID=UPI0033E02D31
MFAYEIDRMNHAQLVREAAAQRLSHAAAESAGATRSLRRLGRRSGGQDPEGRVNGDGRGRFVRAA